MTHQVKTCAAPSDFTWITSGLNTPCSTLPIPFFKNEGTFKHSSMLYIPQHLSTELQNSKHSLDENQLTEPYTQLFATLWQQIPLRNNASGASLSWNPIAVSSLGIAPLQWKPNKRAGNLCLADKEHPPSSPFPSKCHLRYYLHFISKAIPSFQSLHNVQQPGNSGCPFFEVTDKN